MPKSSTQHRDSFSPWLTGFLLCCGLTCLLTSYCKRQTPCDSGLKVKEGFCQGWKRTRGQIVAKGLIGVTYDSLNDRVKRWMFGPACAEVLSSMLERFWVHVCVLSPFHDSVLLPIVRLHPRLLLRPLPRLCGAGPWCAPVKTLSHSLVTEQRSWGWNKLRSWHENMQWGTLPWPRASTSRVCYPSA